jgi:NAD(P)-dependent dehydrogenase (short-subunit alcohol dehydrogenase family)
VRTVVVTGGKRGIGRTIAAAFADEHVVALSSAELDVTDEAAVARVFSEIGAVDVLVNNAGVSSSAPLKRTSLAEWERQHAVNATGAFLCTRAVLEGMRERGSGRIVTVASLAGHVGARYTSGYTASKHAVLGLMRAVAAEVAGTGVTANVIHPGDVKTDMWADIRDRVAGMGPIAQNYIGWAEWVEETGGDPPEKAVELVMRLTADAGGETNGMFCWIDQPLQAPIPSWDAPSDERPWMQE